MRWFSGIPLLLGAMAVLAQAPDDRPPWAALKDATLCVPCHQEKASSLWASRRAQACTPYCMTCHLQADMAQHHPVGTRIPDQSKAPLPLTTDRKVACFTCHDLSRPRYDRVPWKAESLFGRMFRREPNYPTYFLVYRNDQGQLCLACH